MGRPNRRTNRDKLEEKDLEVNSVNNSPKNSVTDVIETERSSDNDSQKIPNDGKPRSQVVILAKTVSKEINSSKDNVLIDNSAETSKTRTDESNSGEESDRDRSRSRSGSRNANRRKFVCERDLTDTEKVVTPCMSDMEMLNDESTAKKGAKKRTPKGKGKAGKYGKVKNPKRRKLVESDSESEEMDYSDFRDSEDMDSDSTESSLSDSSDDERHRQKAKRRRKDRKKKQHKRGRKRSRTRSPRKAGKGKKRRTYKSYKTENYQEELANLREELERLKRGKIASPNQTGLIINTPKKASEVGNTIKSPSADTIYTPAVPRQGEKQTPDPNNPNNFILDYIKNIRISDNVVGKDREEKEASQSSTSRVRSEVVKPNRSDGNGVEQDNFDQVQEARMTAQANVLAAEKYKANLAPTGTYHDPDDDFFHTSCHVESSVRERIKRGEFVELEKLLKKSKMVKAEESRLEIHNKNGVAFLAPANDREKINSVGRWDQAFRIYATIYSQSNPSRAAEIWQYVDVIHRAARVFSWDNVANYDYVFRQLMAENPQRSWSKTYTQMWNLTLCEPASRFNNNGSGTPHANRVKRGQASGVCWRFNKGKCKFGVNCRYEHSCSYCGSTAHSALNCPKKGDKRKDKKADGGEGKSDKK